MTNYTAYDEGLPCKNPSCKSHGKPHPNCQCYSVLPEGGNASSHYAKGGDVEHFCSIDRPHDAKCGYYAEGGTVGQTSESDPSGSVAAYLGTNGLHGILQMGSKPSNESVFRYNQAIKQGHKHINNKVDHLFGGKAPEQRDYSKAKEAINDWIENGGVDHDILQEIGSQNNPQQFAEGGDVKSEKMLHDPDIANAYPAQNILLQAAKGRMSNYLNGLKPQKHAPKLAFDDEPDTRNQEKSYKRAINMAVNPLHVLDKIKSGTVEAEHIQHFKSLHPEMDDALQKKITEKIIHAQMKGEKPSYNIRQGLGMLMGTPLSGEMVPQNIQAAQATFQAKQQQPQTPKKSSASLTKSSTSTLTGGQALIGRSQKQ